MKAEISREAALDGLRVAAAARLFYGLVIEAGDLHNGAWLSALLGLALALPAVWALCRWGLLRRAGAQWLLLVLLALDGAGVMEGIAFSESDLAFNHVPVLVLMLPLVLALARCLWLGGDAIGAAARVWMWIFLPLLLVVVALQWPYYRPGWLCPVLGRGAGGILRCGLRAAGWLALLAGAVLAACDDEASFARVAQSLAFAALAAAGLIALRLMMAPDLGAAEWDRRVRLDSLLTNGRAPLYLQLPMIAMWFTGMLHLLAFEGCLGQALLGRAAPRWKRWARTGLVLAAVTLGAVVGFYH